MLSGICLVIAALAVLWACTERNERKWHQKRHEHYYRCYCELFDELPDEIYTGDNT